MQLCNVIIRLSNSSSAVTTTARNNVTPAEVQVLRSIKGENTVFFNGGLRSVNRSNQAEANRLVSAHGGAFYKIFSAGNINLPQTFGEVALDTSKIIEFDPYVPAPDEAPLLETFEVLDAPVSIETTAVNPLVKKSRKSQRVAEDFGVAQ